MTRVPSGARSSPFLLSATVHHHLHKSEEDYPQTAALLLRSFYVDDLVISVDTTADAEILYEETCQIFCNAGMKVKKWVTNDDTLLRRMFQDSNASIESVTGQTKKVLGVIWDLQQDQLQCSLAAVSSSLENEVTKRQVLQTVSKIYDPLDLISPFSITGKILFQGIWLAGLAWDDPLPEDLKVTWDRWSAEVQELTELAVPRFINGPSSSAATMVHLFAGASPVAYGALAYIETTSEDGGSCAEFLLSKSRVAPIKRQTLPRLELMAALLAARLYRFVCDALEMQLDYVCWTDSSIVLH
ncbi:uncharacterized protein LOC135392412 [Ornithodoros turicata]|uniref:uncharacterized protein LOC135392412 n=1 Tax=Ornithodoros turicata TaxID=34597 RepID=UPI00313959D9